MSREAGDGLGYKHPDAAETLLATNKPGMAIWRERLFNPNPSRPTLQL